jgi:hypothetical protein
MSTVVRLSGAGEIVVSETPAAIQDAKLAARGATFTLTIASNEREVWINPDLIAAWYPNPADTAESATW